MISKIKIDRLALDGDGIGRLDNGQAAFVPYTLPGESVQAQSLVIKKNHSRWLPEKILEKGPSRVEPRCPYHFRPGQSQSCGGCDWQHMATASQETAKRQLVIETLERIGGVKNPPVHPLIRSPQDWRYRNKVQVPFGKRGRDVVAGFFAPGSHRIVEFEDCLVQPTPSVEIVRFVKQFAQDRHWPIYDEDAHRGWLRHLLVRTNEAGQALVSLVAAQPAFPDRAPFVSELRKRFPFVIGIHQNVQSARSHVILGRQWISLWGSPTIDETMLGLTLSCSAGAFFQVNTPAAELLYKKAIQEVAADKTSVVIDLYCGGGAMTLAAAKQAAFAVGIEVVPQAIRDAEANARKNNIRNVAFVQGEVERLSSLRPAPWERWMTDDTKLIVLLDPPRSGCEPAAIQALLKLAPVRIVYVSCHPATLARDVKLLSERYRVTSVTPVDLFPQTSHIETVCKLERL